MSNNTELEYYFGYLNLGSDKLTWLDIIKNQTHHQWIVYRRAGTSGDGRSIDKDIASPPHPIIERFEDAWDSEILYLWVKVPKKYLNRIKQLHFAYRL